jgi:beta-phosphoglucomutase-like phosphatase (HAD superfamily)
LADLGRPLHTASGESSWDLEGYLEAAGVREQFHLLFGVDLVNELKGFGPRYYAEAFRLARVQSTQALVIDDSPAALSQAAELGAATVLVGPNDNGLSGVVDRVLQAIGS